jgi:hypothetical protein
MESNPLKLMMDYTPFHIGAYITLSTLLISTLALEPLKRKIAVMRPFLFMTLLLFMIAGACGGIVASSLPYLSKDAKLAEIRTGPFFVPDAWPIGNWAAAEHLAFWAGIVVALVGIGFGFRKQAMALPTSRDSAELARQLAKDCYEAATRVEHEDAEQVRKVADDLSKIAEAAEKRALGPK